MVRRASCGEMRKTVPWPSSRVPPCDVLDALQGAFQPARGANDADVVPHHQAQLVPVVRDDHLLVGILDLAFVPVGHRLRHGFC
jgi:hypothetical protein